MGCDIVIVVFFISFCLLIKVPLYKLLCSRLWQFASIPVSPNSSVPLQFSKSKTNNNLDFVDEELRFNYFDDLSVLEIVNLLSIGIASHNSKHQVPSNIPSHNQFVPAAYLKSKQYLENIHQWSEDHKMQLNVEKSKAMIFNFTHNYQFTTNLSHNEMTWRS